MSSGFPCDECRQKAAAAGLTIHANPIDSREEERRLESEWSIAAREGELVRGMEWVIYALVERLGGEVVIDDILRVNPHPPIVVERLPTQLSLRIRSR